MIFSLLILAHVLADFTLQPSVISRKKKDKLLYLLLHVLIYGVLSFLLTIGYFNLRLLAGLIVLAVGHGIIDRFKVLLQRKYYIDDNRDYGMILEVFLADQLFHIAFIALVVSFFQDLTPVISSEQVIEILTSFVPLLSYDQLYNWNFSFIILALAILVFNMKGGTIFVRSLLLKYGSDIAERGGKGKAIGNLERLLIIAFILFGVYSLIGFVFTAKSVIRFKEVEISPDQEFVEYYLIGSLGSIFLAVISGFALKQLLALV